MMDQHTIRRNNDNDNNTAVLHGQQGGVLGIL